MLDFKILLFVFKSLHRLAPTSLIFKRYSLLSAEQVILDVLLYRFKYKGYRLFYSSCCKIFGLL